jgi:hypothetical protein
MTKTYKLVGGPNDGEIITSDESRFDVYVPAIINPNIMAPEKDSVVSVLLGSYSTTPIRPIMIDGYPAAIWRHHLHIK